MVKQLDSPKSYELAEKSANVVVIDFYATWCPPCRMIAPMLEQLDRTLNAEGSQTAGKVAFYKVDVDQMNSLAQEKGVTAMPTFAIYKDGSFAKTVVGANMPAIKEAIEEYLNSSTEGRVPVQVVEELV